MKTAYIALLLFFMAITPNLNAQSDTSGAQQKDAHRDSVYAAKINYTGNLMIGGGVGLLGAGSFLIYEGYKTYGTPAAPASPDPAADVNRNHRQGTAYFAAGGIAYVAGAVLIGLGIKNKIEFKHRKKRMELESGWLPDGNMGAMLNF